MRGVELYRFEPSVERLGFLHGVVGLQTAWQGTLFWVTDVPVEVEVVDHPDVPVIPARAYRADELAKRVVRLVREELAPVVRMFAPWQTEEGFWRAEVLALDGTRMGAVNPDYTEWVERQTGPGEWRWVLQKPDEGRPRKVSEVLLARVAKGRLRGVVVPLAVEP